MARTVNDRREYQRGYRRGRARASEWIHKLIELAKLYRGQRVDQGVPNRCATCRRWARGGGGSGAESCRWGICKADFEWSVEGRMWAGTRSGDREMHITTSEDFGCVSWLPKGGG